MEETNSEKEILKNLLISEEDTVQKLKMLVEKSKKYFGIESKSGKIIFHNPNMANRKKILLLLIGKYFAEKLGLIDKNSLSSTEISKQIDTAITTISGPLGELLKKGLIKKEGSEYKIQYFKIESILDSFEESKSTNKIVTKRRTNKKKSKQKSNTVEEVKTLNPIKEQIDVLAKKASVNKEDIYHLYDFDEKVHLLIQPDGKNEGEKQLKATLLILTAYNHYFNEREISSSDLRNMLQDIGITSLVNLSTNLGEHRTLILHKKGKKGSTKTYYRITIPGLQKGYSLIKECLDYGN